MSLFGLDPQWVAAVAALLVFILIATVRRSQPLPSRLHLKNEVQRQFSQKELVTIDAATQMEMNQGMHRPRNLNVVFMFNGHSWDAHEVLGLPAGANEEMVEKAYHVALQRSHDDTKDFLEAAYRAIRQQN